MPDPDPHWCPHCREHHPVTQLVRDHVANGGKVDRTKEQNPMTTTHLDNDTRKSQRHANYPGDHTADLGTVMGPNTIGEHLTVIEATYDDQTDRTRLGFAYSTTQDMEAAR